LKNLTFITKKYLARQQYGLQKLQGKCLKYCPKRNKLKQLALIGNAIFDNASYVDAGDSVIEQLEKILLVECKSTLLAVVRNTTGYVYVQVKKSQQMH